MKIFFQNLFRISRITVIILPFIILTVLIRKDLVLSGHLEFTYDFSQDSPVITNLFPANRLSEVFKIKDQASYWQEINQEPVYFEARLPQQFDTAEVEVVYQNQSQNLVQLGLKTLGDEWSYDFKPLENRLLDNLDWFKLEEDRGVIWQRQKQFLSWDQFFEASGSLNGLAAYGYDLDRKFILPDYRPSSQTKIINRAIRGTHSFYTYLKNEALDFAFVIQDINRKDGPDPLNINVYNDEGEKIYTKSVRDDGLISKYDVASGKNTVSLKVLGLPEGVYRIELDCEDDIFFRSIITKQQYVTFINRLYLADSPEYSDGFVDLNYSPVIIYSTIPRLGFETPHPEGLQIVGLNNQSLALEKTHTNYFITPDSLPTYIYSTKNDLKIFGRGLLAFSQDMYFNPELFELRDLAVTPEINYLVSSYHTPAQLNGWKASKVVFDLTNADILNRKLRFALSSPELNDTDGIIKLKSIKVVLDKQPLSFNELFRKIIKYAKDRF